MNVLALLGEKVNIGYFEKRLRQEKTGQAGGTSSLVVLGPSLTVADKEDKRPDKDIRGPNEATADAGAQILGADRNQKLR